MNGLVVRCDACAALVRLSPGAHAGPPYASGSLVPTLPNLTSCAAAVCRSPPRSPGGDPKKEGAAEQAQRKDKDHERAEQSGAAERETKRAAVEPERAEQAKAADREARPAAAVAAAQQAVEEELERHASRDRKLGPRLFDRALGAVVRERGETKGGGEERRSRGETKGGGEERRSRGEEGGERKRSRRH